MIFLVTYSTLCCWINPLSCHEHLQTYKPFQGQEAPGEVGRAESFQELPKPGASQRASGGDHGERGEAPEVW